MKTALPLLSVGLALGLGALACREPRRSAEPQPYPTVTTSTRSTWTLVRSGLSPRLTAADGLLSVEVEAAFDPETQRLPGVTIKSRARPGAALIGGMSAPLVAPLASDGRYPTHIDARGRRLSVDLSGAFSLEIERPTERAVDARLFLRGPALLSLPADRTEVRATLDGRPSVALRMGAQDPPATRAIRGDRLEVHSSGGGTIIIETSCPRPRLMTPVHRGSTSVFLLILGPSPRLDDTLFTSGPSEPRSAADDALGEPCPPTTTATITLIPAHAR